MLWPFALFAVCAACCETTLVLFSDITWLPATETLLGEWRALSSSRQNNSCAVLWLWWRSELPLPDICGQRRLVCRVFAAEARKEGAQWGQKLYFERIAQRLPAVASELSLLGRDERRGLLVLDSDVVLRRNIGAWIQKEHRTAVLVFQQEWPCQTAPRRLCVNGGVWWARQTAEAQSLLDEAISLMRDMRVPDQDALQIVAKRRAASVAFLDRRRYPNGYTAFLSEPSSLAVAHLVHANWLKSIDCKLETLARLRRREKNAVGFNCTIF